jgi:hypothetical protein
MFFPNSLQEFQPVATEFEKQGWTKFTPHYLVWVCPDSYHQSAECKSQCIRQGRYCTPDPDGDIRQGYSGKDIVQVSTPSSGGQEAACGAIDACTMAQTRPSRRILGAILRSHEDGTWTAKFWQGTGLESTHGIDK